MTIEIFLKVEYDTKVFDLTLPQAAFDFIFELYNFLSAAKADNDSFDGPQRRLTEAKISVEQKQFPTIHNTKRRYDDETKPESKRSRGPPASGGGEDSFGHSELLRAGYTPTQLPKDLTLLTPVSRHSRRCAR
jgi:hypothetical protein